MIDKRLDITVITGFLGAGKTTLLRQLLKNPLGKKIAFILNEIDQSGIDSNIPQVTKFVELSQGCVCCVLNNDLIKTIQDICGLGHIDHIVIETTGLADPLSLIWTVEKPEISDIARLDAIVTLVDVVSYEKALSTEWTSQIRCADLIVLSKTDLASQDEVKKALEAIKTINSQAGVIIGSRNIPIEIILDPTLPDSRYELLKDSHLHTHRASFQSISFAQKRTFELASFENWLENIPQDIFRIKGIVELSNHTWLEFHWVCGRLQLYFDMKQPKHNETRVTLFGKDIDEKKYLKELENLP